jgi:hypothetical protein
MEGSLRRLHLTCMLGYQEEGSRAARFKMPLTIMHGFRFIRILFPCLGFNMIFFACQDQRNCLT